MEGKCQQEFQITWGKVIDLYLEEEHIFEEPSIVCYFVLHPQVFPNMHHMQTRFHLSQKPLNKF